jgi:hypothetical protein
MKKIASFISCLLLFGVSNLFAQNSRGNQKLYIPRNIQQAYQKGTRSKDGTPGPNYWENHASYDIDLHISPPDRTVRGSEQIVYHNNSPDTLKVLVFKLFMNKHKPGAARARQASKKRMTSGIHIDKYKENGVSQKWNDKRAGTWKAVRLAKPLTPDDSVQLSIDWHYKLTKKPGREGRIDSTTYFVAYFYPRVAVYDDYNGWDTMTFTGVREFYNDFNNYKVSVTVPENYVVWGTGKLKNASDVLQPQVLKRYKKSFDSDQTIHVADLNDMKDGKVTTQNRTNTWTFISHYVSDVAYALSDHFVWDAASVVVDNKTQRRASVQAAYNDTAADFQHVVEYGQDALHWMSNNLPGVPYPYRKTTGFQGGAGMEYPMMFNDASHADTSFSRLVAEHEIAHTYFPFYMGTNETRWGFMDEGWATTLEYLMGRKYMGPKKAEQFYKAFRINRWTHDPSFEQELPIIIPGDALQGRGLGTNEYGKPSLAYLALRDMLGHTQFRKIVQGYIHRWHGKHPMPWDFFYTINDLSGKNLNWFWKDWFFDYGYLDIAVQNVSQNGDHTKVTVKNIGGLDIPFDVVMHYADGSTGRKHKTAAIWKDHPEQAVISLKPSKKIDEITLDTGLFVDSDSTDNSWHK